MTPCPDEATIFVFGSGGGDAATRRRVEEHLAECDECRSLVGAVVRSSSMVPVAEPAPPVEAAVATPPVRPAIATAASTPAPASTPSLGPTQPPDPTGPTTGRVVLALGVVFAVVGLGAAALYALRPPASASTPPAASDLAPSASERPR